MAAAARWRTELGIRPPQRHAGGPVPVIPPCNRPDPNDRDSQHRLVGRPRRVVMRVGNEFNTMRRAMAQIPSADQCASRHKKEREKKSRSDERWGRSQLAVGSAQTRQRCLGRLRASADIAGRGAKKSPNTLMASTAPQRPPSPPNLFSCRGETA